MRGWLTGLTIATCLVGFPALALGQEHPAEPGLEALTRVRSRHPLIQALILRGREQSPTFHRLMKAIEASDGIVYIDAGVCRRGVRACLVNVTSAGGYRLVFVKVSTKRADPNLIAAIGHELQHAVEVLSNPAVTGHSSLYYFYKHNRERAGTATAFETQAATDAGHAIADEVRQRQRTTVKSSANRQEFRRHRQPGVAHVSPITRQDSAIGLIPVATSLQRASAHGDGRSWFAGGRRDSPLNGRCANRCPAGPCMRGVRRTARSTVLRMRVSAVLARRSPDYATVLRSMWRPAGLSSGLHSLPQYAIFH